MKTRRVDRYRCEIPEGTIPGMRVPGCIFATEAMMPRIEKDGALIQVANAATLPGAVTASFGMPDIHYGYGFPIGGVLATDADHGVVSPGGVGFDINCGVRLLATPIPLDHALKRIRPIVDAIFHSVPTGVGSRGKIHLTHRDIEEVIVQGSQWAVQHGYGTPDDLQFTEAGGSMAGADPGRISSHAFERGKDQLGTLGSGNHFIEIQAVEKIFDPEIAGRFGVNKDTITVMIHSGSRGLGHQVCTDYLKVMASATHRYNISVPDRQLACAPVRSEEGRDYLAAMSGAANFAWANRQCLMHWVIEALTALFPGNADPSGFRLIYDVAHNIVKLESHRVENRMRTVAVHRKGATRAFGPGHPELPPVYAGTGQPVIIPGDMGTASYLLAGTETAMMLTFGSACHGAGRVLSRKAAMRAAQNRSIVDELERRQIIVRASGRRTIAEEMPEAYKDIHEVIDVVTGAGLALPVARFRPLGVVKG